MVDFKAAESAILKYGMINKGDTVIVALSGGADSMALFHFLLSVKDKLGICVKAAHINHGMRGAESDEDEVFVQKLCVGYGTELFCCTLSPNGEHSEEWARKERYAFLDSLAKDPDVKIATAHTASDNAETVLLNIARGTSLKGASGIPIMRGHYIRPFLGITRRQIEQYCEENKIKYVTDATNFTDAYARNRVRRQLLPILDTIHEGAQGSVCRFAEDMKDTCDYLNAEANRLLELAQSTAGRKESIAFNGHSDKAQGSLNAIMGQPSMNVKTQKQGDANFTQGKTNNIKDVYNAQILRDAMPALQKAALAIILGRYCTVNGAMLERARQLLAKKSGSIQISAESMLYLAKGYLSVQNIPIKANVAAEYSVPFALGEIELWNGIKAQIKTQSYEDFLNSSKVKKKDLFFYADCGRIQIGSLFRIKKAGDVFALPGRNVSKTIKKLFNEDGILPAQREQMPLLVCGKQVLWMPIYGFCSWLLPDENTKTIISITLLEDMEEL